MPKLTPKQESFARNIALEGMSQQEAYRSSYDVAPNAGANSVTTNASHLASNESVATRVDELREQSIAPTIISFQARLSKLTDIVNDDRSSRKDIMLAVDLLNKSEGVYIQKIEQKTMSVDLTASLVDLMVLLGYDTAEVLARIEKLDT